MDQLGNNEEHEAESNDSGCVPDSILETNIINWKEVNVNLNLEYNFAKDLLQHCPRTLADTTSIENIDKENVLIARSSIIQNNNEEGKNKKTKNKNKKIKSTPVKSEKSLKRDLSEKIKKLRKGGKIGSVSLESKEHELRKVRKQLAVIENKRKKKIKKMERFNRIGDPKVQREAYPGIPAKAESGKQIYNQCGKIVFNKFDFSHTVSKDKWEENKKKVDLNDQLQNVLREKEKVKKLQEKGNTGLAVDFLEKKAWSNAFKKADGKKVKDDPLKLVKSIKKQKIQKVKSKKKWDDKEKMAKKFKDIKDDKKQKNILKRRQLKADSKLKGKNKVKKTKVKKGGTKKKKNVPGF